MEGRTTTGRVPTASRPRTGARPTTSARPLTSTGLVAPKTARGKTAGLRRQVQDKSFWIGVIKAKMNELTAEIQSTNKECETMEREQSRMAVWQRSAESLARELGQLTHELSIYNEFTDRIRLNESVDMVKEDIESLKEENDEINSRLEKGLEEKKHLESLIKSYEEKLNTAIQNRGNIRKNFSPEQSFRFNELEQENKTLSLKIASYEEELSKLKQRKGSLVSLIHSGQSSSSDSGGGSSFFLKKEILAGFENLKSLEKQRDELIDQDTSSEKVTGKFLGQIKRDNKEISALELQFNELNQEVRKAKEELELYQTDSDMGSKYQELKSKSETMDLFVEQFGSNRSEEIDKVFSNGKSVNETMESINRVIEHIDSLKQSEEESIKGSKRMENLMDEKRKLELDLSKMLTLESKISSELESLKNKNKILETEIDTYGNIEKLKKEMDEKFENLKESKESLADKSDEIRKNIKIMKSSFDTKKSELTSNDTYKNLRLLEVKLSDIVSTNFRIQTQIDETDNSALKSKVMEDVKKYNQKLQGY